MTDNRLWRLGARAPIALTAALTIAFGIASPAFAAWSTNGAGTSAGAATTMPTGTTPSGTVTLSTVKVSWSTATLGNGIPVAGYVINRYNATTGAPQTVGAACSAVITTTSCTESAVPAGKWVYTDTPVQLSWTGGQSPDSAQIIVG